MSVMMKTAPLRTHSAAVYPYSLALAERFTLESRFDDPFELFHHQEAANELWLPRRLAPETGLDLREDGLLIPFHDKFVPRNEDQERVVSESRVLMSAGLSHIVQAPTGYGKTYVGCAVAAHVQRKTLVLTTKEDLLDQWVKAAKAVLGLKAADIGQWRGDIVPKTNQPFVVALVHSVLKGPNRYPGWLFRDYGLVIADEVQRMGADTFTQAMWWLPAKLRLGLSATPYRKDGKEVVFQSHIGDVMVVGEQETLIPKVLMKHTTWKVPRVMNKDKTKLVKLPHSAGRTMHLMKSLTANVERNVEIAKFVRIAYAKGRTIVVFADTIDHLKAMRAVILASGVPEAETGWYVGLTSGVYSGPTEARLKARDKAKVARVVFATYKFCSEGTDVPWWDTCVLGSPRGDVVQIVGRIRREYEGKKEPLVFDLVDKDSAVFAGYARSRLNWYSSLGCPVRVYR